ncbi:MAG: protoporphyrinogen/coproporphyrinogen oxidase [Myxococcota bacterium]
MADADVVVIGSGLGGLGAATWLRQLGRSVQVLEASDRPGGRMRTLERRGDRVDVGAQFFHSNYRHCLELIEVAGLSASRSPIQGKTQYRFADGSSYCFGHKARYIRPLGVRGHVDLLRFLLRYVVFGKRFPMYQISRDIPEYDGAMLSEVVPPGRFLDLLAKPVCWGETQCGPDDTSLYHFIHQLRLTTMTDFFGLSEGVASLCERLAERVVVRYEAPVRSLLYERDRVTGVALEDGSQIGARHVIVAVPPQAAARLLPDALGDARSFLAGFDYLRIPIPVFFLDRPLHPDVWSYFSDPGQERPFMLALDQAAKMPAMVPSGKALLTVWPHYPSMDTLMARPDDEVLRTALGDLEHILPGVSGWVEDAALVRHTWGTAWYTRGAYGRILRFRREAERLLGVSFVSSAYGGTHMEATLVTAERAVQRARAVT